jgi:hypothetical protein
MIYETSSDNPLNTIAPHYYRSRQRNKSRTSQILLHAASTIHPPFSGSEEGGKKHPIASCSVYLSVLRGSVAAIYRLIPGQSSRPSMPSLAAVAGQWSRIVSLDNYVACLLYGTAPTFWRQLSVVGRESNLIRMAVSVYIAPFRNAKHTADGVFLSGSK